MREKMEGMGTEGQNVRRADVQKKIPSWESGGGPVVQREECKVARETEGQCLHDSQKNKKQLLPL